MRKKYVNRYTFFAKLKKIIVKDVFSRPDAPKMKRRGPSEKEGPRRVGTLRRSAAETAAFDRMLADYAGTRAQLRAVFFLMDCRRPPAAPERDSVAYFTELGRDVVLVATKADKLNASARAAASRAFSAFFGVPPERVIFSSARNKTGREALLREIEIRLPSA